MRAGSTAERMELPREVRGISPAKSGSDLESKIGTARGLLHLRTGSTLFSASRSGPLRQVAWGRRACSCAL